MTWGRWDGRRKAAVLLLLLLLFGGLILLMGRSDDSSRGSGAGQAVVPSTAGVQISGAASSTLRPGVLTPLTLRLHNTTDQLIVLDQINVEVSEVRANRATTQRPCTEADYQVRQSAPRLRLAVLPGETVVHTSTEVRGPAVGILDRPANQDGCQGAVVTLAFTAS